MTNLIGPFDLISSKEKVALVCAIPTKIKTHLFDRLFPARGAIDKTLCRFVNALHEWTLEQDAPIELSDLTERQREYLLNELLNDVQEFVQQHRNNKLPKLINHAKATI